MPRRGVKFSGARPTSKRERPIDDPEPHICEVCWGPARWGYGVRLLKGQPGRWFCTSHKLQEASHES